MSSRRIYFDNAATSSPKPAGVLRAMVDYATRLGGTPGRGNYYEAREAGRLMHLCRERICRLVGGSSPDHVVFALNTSDALNLAIKGIVHGVLRRSESATAHVVLTEMEHNSVLRPVNALIDAWPGRVSREVVPADPATGLVDPGDVRRAILARADTALVAVNHVSNVTGTIQPVSEIGRACRELGVPLLVDAAQSLGHVRCDVEESFVDLLAFPGHKGLLGPTGTGGLYIRPGLESKVVPLREGGTGSRSDSERQPETMPDKYEPGSQNAIGVIGLSEGVRFLLECGAGEEDGAALLEPEAIASAAAARGSRARGSAAVIRHEQWLIRAFLQRLIPEEAATRGVRLLGPTAPEMRTGVFTFVSDWIDPHAAAAVLESEFGVLGRAGIHCAPLAHQLMAREPGPGGGFRLSFGPFLSVADVEFAADAVLEVCGQALARSGRG